eukprot:gene42399-56332_t
MGFFPVDEKTIDYFQGTGRTKAEIEAFEAYFKAQGLFGVPLAGEVDYSQVVTLDLGSVTPSLAGPKRPQDRIELGQVSRQFADLFSQPAAHNGFNRPAELLHTRFHIHRAAEVVADVTPDGKPTPAGAPRSVVEMEANKPALATAHAEARSATLLAKGADPTVGNGDVLIAAITSCTNTSNPSVLLAAGLLAKKAVEAGLKVQPHIKTSLAPGSRIVTEYLSETGLLPYLEKLGFSIAGYGCTTCIGNAGDLTPELNAAIATHDIVASAVLSGNRNFEDFVDGKAPNADRRRQYLTVVTELLIDDLTALVKAWAPDAKNNYRAKFVRGGNESVRKMLVGLGSLSRGELAGERLEVALNSQDQEDEHSCFSDNTHRDAVTNAQGIRNVWLGEYQRADGSMVKGPSLRDLVAAKDAALAAKTTQQIAASVAAAEAIQAPFD